MICQEKGCNKKAIECDYLGEFFYYCPEHAYEHGFCSRCGGLFVETPAHRTGSKICIDCLTKQTELKQFENLEYIN